jgi:hypothetical protein
MNVLPPHQESVGSSDGRAILPQQTRWKKRAPFLLQWFLVVCFGLGLLFLIQLHPSSGSSDSAPVQQIACDQGEQLAFHVHVHLSIYIDGQAVVIPAAIGISSTRCLYWLHTHTPDGIIHEEAPHIRSFVLGDFLALWQQRFSQLNYPRELNTGAEWRAFVNGVIVKGDFHAIPLKTHTLLTLAYRSPDVQPDTSYNWSGLDP